VASLATLIIVFTIIKFPNRVKRLLYNTQKKGLSQKNLRIT
jgi:hypothetical protein